jgi:peroxiredoxin
MPEISFRGRNQSVWLGLLAWFFALAGSGGLAVGPARSAEPPPVGNFTLKDCSGRSHTRADWKGSQAVVLFYLGTECPVSNSYTPEMTRLARAYGTRGVLFWGVHPDPDLTPAEAAQHAREYHLKFPVLLDPKQFLAIQTGVRVVPEVVVLSPTGKVLYRGRIDDKYSLDGKRKLEAHTRDLESALQAVLARKKIAVPRTRAYGCPLLRPVGSSR